MNLIYKNERPLFYISLLISILAWSWIVIATKGAILIALPFGFLFYIFAQSAFINHFRGKGALLSSEQFPDLHAKLVAAVQKLQMEKVPATYLINANGVFNAFATKFMRRYYVILNSAVVDALQDNPDGINFYIGHELGHIRRKHLLWHTILAPSSVLPLLGAGYLRAREYTCDLHGAACCVNPNSAAQALAVLGVGAQRWKNIDFKSYIAQGEKTRSFWMSFNELVASYPWLTKRFIQVSPDFKGKLPRHNPFAYLLAMFVPGLNVASILVIYGLSLGGVLKGQALIKAAQERQAAMQSRLAAPPANVEQPTAPANSGINNYMQ